MAVAGRRGSPWAVLAARPDIVVRFADLSSTGARGACCRSGDGWLIVLCTSLDQVSRSAVLAHELQHVERGGGVDHPAMPVTWAAIVRREELLADRATAAAMVPVDVLRDWLCRQDGGVTAGDVALEWEVPVWLAVVALELAGERWAA
jgi:hypothetical protein